MRSIPWIACALMVVMSCGCQSTARDATSTGVETEAAPAAAAADAPPAAAEPAAPSAAGEGEEEYKNTLKWTTASEVNNFGYYIYRSLSEEGPFERITADPLPGAGTTDEPTSYVFDDTTIDPTQGYWYYIESISMSGVYEKFSPVTFIKPKKPVEE